MNPENNNQNEELIEAEDKTENKEDKPESKLTNALVTIIEFIFSEKFTAILLSIMSIIISYFAWQNDMTSRQIANKELEILENDREAYFTISKSETVNSETDSDTFITEYTVSNDGGRINGVYIRPSTNLEILVNYSAPAKDGADSVYFIESYKVSLPDELFDIRKEAYEAYDESAKSFSVYSNESIDLYKFISALDKEIGSISEHVYAVSTQVKKLDISYCNYENINKRIEYVFNDDYMYANPEENDGNLLDYAWNMRTINYEITEFDEENAKELANIITKTFLTNMEKSLLEATE